MQIYFSSILGALHMLGSQGYGRDYAHFVISRITNSQGEDLLDDGNIIMNRYQIQRIADYVAYRKRQLHKDGFNGNCTLKFFSPLTLKFGFGRYRVLIG